jgi:hypothetical protein
MIMSIGAGVLIAVLLGIVEILTGDYGTTAAIWIIGLIVVLSVVLMLRFVRLATVVDATGLVIKGFATTRRVPWSRIQAIIVETNASSLTEERHPKEIAVAYLDTGRRLQLAGVDDKNLAATNRQLPVEVELLRQRWIAGRGASWQPVAAVQAKAAEMARYKVSSAVVGLLGFICAIVVMVVVAVVLVVVQGSELVDGDSDALPILLGLVFCVPTVVGIVAWIGSVISRRRARLAGPH